MTNEELNKAIAESLGVCVPEWEVNNRGHYCKKCGKFSPLHFFPDYGDVFTPMHPPTKNYCSDLNAMHEAGRMLSDVRDNDEWSKYCIHLNYIACRIKCKNTHTCGYTISATARQRAEAYAKTKGIWKE